MQHSLIVTDCDLLAAGLTTIVNTQPDFEVVATVTSGLEALTQLASRQIDVVMIDLAIRSESGLHILGQVHTAYPRTPILVIDNYDAHCAPSQMIDHGALGYVLADSPAHELIHALQAVAYGQLYLDHHVVLSQGALNEIATTKRTGLSGNIDRLSPREHEVLPLIVMGYTNKQIAQKLYISVKTVESHKSSIMRKLAVSCHCDLVKYAVQHHLVTL